MKSPKFIFFDLGNVLIHFDHQLAVSQIAQVSGVEMAQVKQVVFDFDLQRRYETGQISTSEFHQSFCRQTGSQVSRDQLMLAASRIFWLNRSMVPLVAMLRLAHIRLGIISNTCEAHWQYILQQNFNVINLVEHRVLSFQVKVAKPHADIYQQAAHTAGEEPGDMFFVDDRQENVDAARQAGMDAVCFHSTIALLRELEQRGLKMNY